MYNVWIALQFPSAINIVCFCPHICQTGIENVAPRWGKNSKLVLVSLLLTGLLLAALLLAGYYLKTHRKNSKGVRLVSASVRRQCCCHSNQEKPPKNLDVFQKIDFQMRKEWKCGQPGWLLALLTGPMVMNFSANSGTWCQQCCWDYSIELTTDY